MECSIVTTSLLEFFTKQSSLFKHRSVVGELNYLTQISRADICCVVHQCAKYSSNPHTKYTEAIVYLAKYLNVTEGLSFGCHQINLSLQYFANVDFCGNWDKDFADIDSEKSKSQSGWFVSFSVCPIWWASKIQTHAVTFTTMAKYVTLSSVLEILFPLWNSLKNY